MCGAVICTYDLTKSKLEVTDLRPKLKFFEWLKISLEASLTHSTKVMICRLTLPRVCCIPKLDSVLDLINLSLQ